MEMLKLTPKQQQFWLNSNKRWNIKCGATRSGKTYLDFYLIPKRIRAVSGMDGLYVMLGNTKSTLQRNIIEPLQNIWGTELVSNIRSDNTATLFGEKVHCIGADKVNQVDRIRGSSIKYCYGDEVVTWHEDVFNMLKSRLDKEYSKFDGTCNPENPNHWFKSFIDTPDIDMFCQHYTLYDNPFLSPAFVKSLETEYAGTIFFDRYIKGLWVRAEGIIFPNFANNPDKWIISKEEVPKRFRYCEVGFDIGGNGSAYAMTCTGCGYDGIQYKLKAEKRQAANMTMDDVVSFVTEFCEDCEKKYGVNIDMINCDHIAVIVNTINDNTKYRAGLCYKPPVPDRVFLYSRLLATNKVKFVKGMCDDLIEEMQNLVFDTNAKDTRPLDDGSMQIDTWDSNIYSESGYWNYIEV